MNLRQWPILLSAMLMAIAVNATAAPGKPAAGTTPDAAKGAAISAECAMCHGSNGMSVAANIPNLAGQHYAYLLHQLKAFKAGTIKNALMNQMAHPLSKQQMQDLAAYFASISIHVGTPAKPKAMIAKGD